MAPAIGAEAVLLGCGAPILPSVGGVDAMRVGPDIKQIVGVGLPVAMMVCAEGVPSENCKEPVGRLKCGCANCVSPRM